MTEQELKEAFIIECTESDTSGNTFIKGTPTDIINWIADKFCQHPLPPFSKAFTGMYDKNGAPSIFSRKLLQMEYLKTWLQCNQKCDAEQMSLSLAYSKYGKSTAPSVDKTTICYS